MTKWKVIKVNKSCVKMRKGISGTIEIICENCQESREDISVSKSKIKCYSW